VVSGKRAKAPEKKVVWTGADSGKQAPVLLPTPAIPLHDTGNVRNSTTTTANPLIEQLAPVLHKRLDYTTFKGKAKMSFEGPDDKEGFTGHIRIKKDSVIWITITALGGMYQPVRIFITPDSFFMLNYRQQQVTRVPLSQADKFLPAKVDFASLQNLIIGAPLRDGIITDATNQGDSLTLQVEDSSYLQRIVYNKSDSTMRNSYMRTRKPNGPQALAEYNAYIIAENRKISTGRIINIQNGSDIYMLYMNFSKIDFDEVLDYPFSIPAGYKTKE
jgi:hypothetical protein